MVLKRMARRKTWKWRKANRNEEKEYEEMPVGVESRQVVFERRSFDRGHLKSDNDHLIEANDITAALQVDESLFPHCKASHQS